MSLVVADDVVDVLVGEDLELFGGVRPVHDDGVVGRVGAETGEEAGLDDRVRLERGQDVALDGEGCARGLGDLQPVDVEDELSELVTRGEVGTSRVADGEAAGDELAVVQVGVLVVRHEHQQHDLA